MWHQIANGYHVCFDIKKKPQELKESFCKSITGYTLHALKLTDDGKLMGHNYFQPRPYILNGKKVICALSGGTFVFPEYRKDIFIFKDLFNALCKKANELNWVAQIGVPNENSFEYCRKIIKEKYIGDLNYYILPVHCAKTLKRKNKLIDLLSSFYALSISNINAVISNFINSKEVIAPLHLNESIEYLNIRLSNPVYKNIHKGNIKATYRLYTEDGIKTAYILHFSQNGIRTAKSLAYIVKTILKHEKIDAILYIGTMNMNQWLLTRVPQKYVPHKLPVCVSVFDKSNKTLMDICTSMLNIDYGLINFDVR